MNQIEHIMKLADSFAEYRDHSEYVHDRQALRTAIEQALAVQPKQEPARDMPHGWVTNWPSPDGGTKPVYHASAIKPKYGAELDEKLTIYPVYTHPQPEKRPQNCGTGFCSCIECPYPDHFPDAGKMMEREWVDLPPEEIKALANLPGADRERTAVEMAYAVQAKLREKNT
jgi:hypothetical protein